MPQHSMFPDDPRLDGLRLTIIDRSPELDPTFRFGVECRYVDQDWRTLRLDVWYGLMLDFATTWGSEMVASYLFGQGGEDLFKTGHSVTRAARHHHEAHNGIA